MQALGRGWGRWAFAVLLVGVTVGSLLPPRHLPPLALDVWDKAQHALAYAALTLLARWGWPQARGVWVVLALLAHGALIEGLQHASGWRHGDPFDWTADAIGIALGMAFTAAVWRQPPA